VPCITDVDGVPEITGAPFVGAGAGAVLLTVIANAGNCAVPLPSLTLIAMLLNVPTLL
jgi:hypothetical protein